MEAHKWLLDATELAQLRQQAHDETWKALQTAWSTGSQESQSLTQESKSSAPKAVARPPALEQTALLVRFYAKKLAELTDLCGATGDILWTALVFYQRFYAMASPLEFDPMTVMFAVLHLACLSEEVRELSLDSLLKAAALGSDAALEAKIASLEMFVAEGIGFGLLIEPKPASALEMMSRPLLSLVGSTAPSSEKWCGICSDAEAYLVRFAVLTDAVLLWPTSVLVAASLHRALDDVDVPSKGVAAKIQVAIGDLLSSRMPTEGQRKSVKMMLKDAVATLREVPDSLTQPSEEDVKDVSKAARRCQKVFEKMRDEASAQALGAKKERRDRKRLWAEIQGGSSGQSDVRRMVLDIDN
mmetsp:Transcript_19535/g.45438  ORF Transcript_19535/g.45438 Transcript_19535/m.45438 type:complete len:357 (+) Transcript_19535:81-1151(+)